MHIGYGTRAVSSPIASGQIGRFSVPTRFVPLSQFFLQGSEVEKGEKALYGRQERPKAKGSKGTRKPPAAQGAPEAPQEEGVLPMAEGGPGKGPWDKPHKCSYCDAPATRDLIWADGRAFIPVCNDHRKKGEHQILVKNKDKIAAAKPVAQEGITTTANVPTVAVPIGGGDGRKFLDSPDDKKKRKKKDLSDRMGLLLRRLF